MEPEADQPRPIVPEALPLPDEASSVPPSAGDVGTQPPTTAEATAVFTAVPPPMEPETQPQRHTVLWVVLVVGFVGYVGLWFGTKEMQRIAMTGLQVLPFLGLALLASLGIRHEWARVLTFIWWALLLCGTAFVAVLLTFVAVVNPELLAQAGVLVPDQAPRGPVFVPGGGWQLLLTFLSVALAVPLGLLAYVPSVRRWLLRSVPYEPDWFLHATALATVMGTTLICFLPLVILGEPPILLLMEHIKNTKLWEELSGELSVRDQLYVLVWLVPAAILAAGYPIRRGLRETLKRVGLVRPSRGQILLALGVTAALVLLGTGFDNGVAWLWQRLGWPQTDANAFNELIKFAVSPLGAVVVGVTAGVGEELAVRGVLQPRLGILLSNLFFTALHAFQYNFDALLSVFLLGLVLGCIRKYTNTTTSALIHGLYDFTLVLLAFLEVPGF